MNSTINYHQICIWILTLIQFTCCDMADGSCGATSSQPEECARCSQQPSTKPYFRTALARSVYTKILQDNEFEKFNRSKWYEVDVSGMDPRLARLLLVLDASDASTQAFLDACRDASDAVLTQLWHLVARTCMSPFLTQTAINGLLRRGSMFVISAEQFRRLFRLPEDYSAERMLDLGAGDGATTSLLAPMFQHIHATEISWPMKRILSAKGFALEEIDGWSQSEHRYDVICALNLLDRCSHPKTLLEQIHQALKPDGLVLLALVWPFQPYVETTVDHQPVELLPIDATSIQNQASSFINDVLQPLGFDVIAWSKVPYLCQGDLHRTFYNLPDLLFALKLRQ